MNWINGFEILCYAITLIIIIDIVRRKRREEFLLFLAAAIAGFALELLAVRLTDIYHYSKDFYISIGFEPYQFPFFGGLMWGGLAVCALRIAAKLKLSGFMTALVSGWLIVTMDLFLDVAAIRLNGGFWVWDGRSITPDITHHMFMSVIWVNFLGYLFETPAMIYISLKTAERRKRMPLKRQLTASVLTGAGGVAFTGAASGLSLFLNSITDEWFACIAFVILWLAILTVIIRKLLRSPPRFLPPAKWDLTLLIYWLAMYGFCTASLIHLGIARKLPLYFMCAVIFGAGTLALSVMKEESSES